VTTTADEALYVYALVEPGLPRTFRLLGHGLHVLHMSGVGVVVERRRSRGAPEPETLKRQHELVVELDRRAGALLPARFGSLISRGALTALIATHADAILEALARVRGRRQMTLRVFGAIESREPAASTASSGTEYLARRRERAHAVPDEVRTIRDVIGDVAAERVAAGPSGIVAVYHLVPSRDIAAYRRKASTLQGILAPRQVTVSGPWPAFAFAPELL
jgi:hypothetical protein